jgi:hypothetical protein
MQFNNLGFLWNFIRVEREHIANMGAFKAVPECEFPYDSATYETLSSELVKANKVQPINL